MTSIQLHFFTTIIQHCTLFQIDIKKMFLHGDLDKEVFIVTNLEFKIVSS